MLGPCASGGIRDIRHEREHTYLSGIKYYNFTEKAQG